MARLNAGIGGTQLANGVFYYWLWNSDRFAAAAFSFPARWGLMNPWQAISPEGWRFFKDHETGDCGWYTPGTHAVHQGRYIEGFQLWSDGNRVTWNMDCIITSIWWNQYGHTQSGLATTDKVLGPAW